jgi:Methylpurine-DNA glycosylase (MPG)
MDGHPPLARSELPIDTVSLARYLIGRVLVRELPEGVAGGRIIETEAYVFGDAVGHAYRGMTRCPPIREHNRRRAALRVYPRTTAFGEQRTGSSMTGLGPFADLQSVRL